MFAVTLITSPAAPSLDPALADSLRNAWGGGDLQWLAPDEAAEFPVQHRPPNIDAVREDLRGHGVDIAIQPAAGRRKAILLADMDSTMIRQECIDELADEAGVGARVADITARAMNGELNFESALRARVALLKGLPEHVITRVLATRIHLMPGGPVLLATMKANGAYTALVSGGFTAFTAAIAATLGFDEHRANTLIAEDGVLTGEVGEPILGKQAKLDSLHRICAARGLAPRDVLAVGDGANDLAMLSAAGAGVALHAKPAVAAQTRLRIDHSTLR